MSLTQWPTCRFSLPGTFPGENLKRSSIEPFALRRERLDNWRSRGKLTVALIN
jgi:hypothetical protein